MAKKNNIPLVEAPVVDQKGGGEEKKTPITTKQIPASMGAMDQRDKVLYAHVLQHRKDEMKQNGGSPEMYEGLTAIEDSVIIDIAVTELIIRKNPHALILTANEKNYTAVKLLAKEMGVDLPDFKSLPKPTKEELTAAGLIGQSAEGKVALRLEEKNVNAEAKKKIKQEEELRREAEKVNKEYMKDPTKIETDEQLHEALGFQLVNFKITNPIDRLITTAEFYRSYREILAEKADDPKAELDKIHELSLADLLSDIITMVPPTFVTSGLGKRLCTLAEDANSVVPAFCGFKNCVYNKKTGKYKYDDATIAAFVRVLIVWYVSSKSAELSEGIAEKEKNIATLKKDAKANAKGIETEEKKIAGLKSAIVHFTNMISLVTDPSFDIADDFIAAYKNKDHAAHLSAVSIAKEIFNTYYSDANIPELEFDSALLNVQQLTGIILNLFSTVVSKRDEYSEENLIEFSESKPKGDDKKEPESKGDGESKNS